jgi:hypothetical protein
MRRLPCLVTAPLLLAAACAGRPPRLDPPAPAAPPAPPSVFPTAEALERLAVTPAAPRVLNVVDVPAWDLAGPFPETVDESPRPLPAPWAALWPATAQSTADLACVARELARFQAEHGSLPGTPLRRHIGGWCGSVALDWETRLLVGTVPTRVSEAQVAKQWAGQLGELTATLPADAPRGVAFARHGETAVVLVATARPRVRLDAIAVFPEADGSVRLRGEVLAPAEELRVLVNRGRLEVVECTRDPAVALPAFAARCPIEASDASAWIEIAATPPGRVLGLQVFRMLARRPEASPQFSVPELGLAGDQAVGVDGLAAALNVVRQAAGLSPLRLVADESALAARLAPHYFATPTGDDTTGVSDQVALGLMAGWNTGGAVTGASFYSSWTQASDARQLILNVIDSPMARFAFFDPVSTHLAVGGLADGDRGAAGALFVTYRMLEADAASASASQLAAVQQARAARRLPAAGPMHEIDDQAEALSRGLADGSRSPASAMTHLVSRAAHRLGRDAQAFVATADSLAGIAVPADVLIPGDVNLFVLAAPYRAPSEPWWRWAVVFVITPR